MKKIIRNAFVLLAIGAGAATYCEACLRLGGATTRIERTAP